MFGDLFEDAVEEGMYHGIVVGIHNGLDGHLINSAIDMLKSKKIIADTPEKKGVRSALRELGYVKRKWLIGPYVRTEKKYKGEEDAGS